MMKFFKIKPKIINLLMRNGHKKTGEKIVLKFNKLLQKSTVKSSKALIQLAIINSTPSFKLNEQIIKRGKRKVIKISSSFITFDSVRILNSLKFIKIASLKNQKSNSFYEKLMDEILSSSELKGKSVEKKNEIQKEVLLNKRYLSKFRW